MAAWFKRRGNRITIVETLVGFGFGVKLERGETPPGGNPGEIAVDEYAMPLHRDGPRFSADIDIFHHREEQVTAAAVADAAIPTEAGLAVSRPKPIDTQYLRYIADWLPTRA